MATLSAPPRASADQGGEVTRLLRRWRGGEPRALEELTTVVYDELRRLAYHVMRSERPEHPSSRRSSSTRLTSACPEAAASSSKISAISSPSLPG